MYSPHRWRILFTFQTAHLYHRVIVVFLYCISMKSKKAHALRGVFVLFSPAVSEYAADFLKYRLLFVWRIDFFWGYSVCFGLKRENVNMLPHVGCLWEWFSDAVLPAIPLLVLFTNASLTANLQSIIEIQCELKLTMNISLLRDKDG